MYKSGPLIVPSNRSRRVLRACLLVSLFYLFSNPLFVGAHELVVLPQEGDTLVFATSAEHLGENSINFGEVLLGSSADEPVTVTNTDSRALTVTIGSLPAGVSVSPSQFSLASAGTAGDSAALQVAYSATMVGAFAETVSLDVQHQGVAKPKVEGIALEGVVVDINSIVQDSVDFGLILVDNESTETVTVTNTSQYSVTITPPASLPADMDISPSQVTLAPAGQAGDSSTFDLTRLATQTAGAFSGDFDFELAFSGVAGTSEETLSYSGEIMDPPPVDFAPTELSFGFIPFHESVEKYLTISNPGTELLTVTPAAATESSGVVLSETNPTPIPGSDNFVLGVTVQAGGTPEIIAGTIDVEVTYDGIAGSSFQSVPFEAEAGPEVYTPIASPRGYRPNQPFQVGEIDTIDTASGNVTIRVPLGQVYEVGPLLRYQFTAVNNSNAWEFIPICDAPSASDCPSRDELNFAVPNAGSNAGLGWELHFGKLFAHDAPTGLTGPNGFRWPNHDKRVDFADKGSRWLYVAPDGTRHTLHSLPGRNNGLYSKDGSFIRLRTIDSSTRWVEFPDGRYSVFKNVGNTSKGTDFCGNGVSGCWRLESINDRFGNNITFSYHLAGDVESWIVKDSTNRQHVIRFDVSDPGTAGGDATGSYQTDDGDEWGDLRRVVDKVELAAFSGTAVYDFKYSTQTVGRSCVQNPNGGPWFESPDPQIETRILDEIVMPGSAPLAPPWKFTTNSSSATVCGDTRGKVTGVTLPTRGKIQYVYSNSWETPTRCDYRTGGVDAPVAFYRASGIKERRVLRPDDSLESKWTYSTDIFPNITGSQVSGPTCERAKYRVTTVDGPTNFDGKHTRTVNYHSIWEGPRDPFGSESGNGWQVSDQGLPYTKGVSIGTGTLGQLFLSSQIYQCNGGACGSPERSIYRRFVSEFRGICDKKNGLGDSAGCYQINPIQLAERTVFHDDSGKYLETRGSGLDGAGHFRTLTTTDDFSGSTASRSVTTLYTATGGEYLGLASSTGYINPGTPSSYLPAVWILTPYEKVTKIADGRTYVTEAQFNKGVLSCSRTWRSPGARGPQDVVVSLGLGTTAGTDAGLPVTETVSGGHYANLSTGSICVVDSTTTDGRKYTFNHVYQDLQLKSTRIGNFPYRYRADINQSTGLPSRVYNPSEEGETLTFDLLGRLTSITPDTSRNEATTSFFYSNSGSANPSLTVDRKDGLTLLSREKTVYDHLGRKIEHEIRHPNGTTTDRHTIYDGAGNLRVQTTRQPNGSVNDVKSWRHTEFDAFGRPGKTWAPDGKETKYTYNGVRHDKVEVQVETANGLLFRPTDTTRDAWGRTIKVSTYEHVTDFEVDPNGMVTKAIRYVPMGTQQERIYGYDARGYLLSENLPEVTGTLSYKPDALGLARQVTGGGNDLKYLYDGNGRLTTVRNAEPNGVLWKTWSYGTGNSGSNKALGRVVDAARYNYPPGREPVAIFENYEYENGTAGPSEVRRQIYWPDRVGDFRFGATFETDFSYDKLGNPASLSYPICAQNHTSQGGLKPCQDGDDTPGPAGVANWTYSNGLMTSVSTNAGIGASYGYHSNLQMASASFNNGILGTYDEGTNGMARPRRRQFETSTAVSLFDTGLYSYDGAGNIKSIGSDVYKYDGASRLVSSTVNVVAPGKFENYAYDTLDNLTTVSSDFFSREFTIDTSTNRILEAGVPGSPPIEAVSFTYDNAGNTTSVGGATIQYDDLNMQTRFTAGANDLISVYGPGDYRAWAEDASTGERHWTSRDPSGRILREFTVTGDMDIWTHEKDYVYGAEGILASRDNSGPIRYFHLDHLGTARVFTSGQEDKVGEHHYYPFGREACFDPSNPAPNNDCDGSQYDEQSVKYTGHQRELHNEAYYMRGRHYINYSYRFGSVDPARDGWNLYAYGANNPIRYLDRTGRQAEEPETEPLPAGQFAIVIDNRRPTHGDQELEAASWINGQAARIFEWLNVFGKAGTLFRASKGASFSPGARLVLSRATQTALVSGATRTTSRGGVTAVGRAIQKHADRPGGSYFQKGRNNAENAQIGSDFIKSLLKDPSKTVSLTDHQVWGQIVKVRLPNGAGATWKSSGEFVGLLEPYTGR